MMTSNHVNVGDTPFFDGSNYDYWKTCMRIHLKATSEILWNIVDKGYVILNATNLTETDNENLLAYAQDMNVIIRALCIVEYHRVCKLEIAHGIWGKLMEDCEGTWNVKSAKLFICKGKFEKFVLWSNEDFEGLEKATRGVGVNGSQSKFLCKNWPMS
jgi:hypothetical protein